MSEPNHRQITGPVNDLNQPTSRSSISHLAHYCNRCGIPHTPPCLRPEDHDQPLGEYPELPPDWGNPQANNHDHH